MMTVRALFAASGFLAVLAVSPALAAQDADREPVKVADASRAIGSLAVSAEAEPETYACNKARRRLWIEGEGWVVRRITTCR